MSAEPTEFLPIARPPTVRARHAASLIVWRREAEEVTVLMGMRGAHHRFMPNKLVFPGGAVDAADKTAAFATPLPAATRAALERSANPALARALAIAAARELVEETGLCLGTPPKLDGLHYLCRAITPPRLPIRFNARFLTVAAEHVSGEIKGNGELEALRFYSLRELHELGLAWITREVLGHFGEWLQSSEPALRTRFPVCRHQRWGME